MVVTGVDDMNVLALMFAGTDISTDTNTFRNLTKSITVSGAAGGGGAD